MFDPSVVTVICSHCEEEKPRVRKWSRVCRECIREQDNARYQREKENPEYVRKNRERARAYYETRKQEVGEYWKKRYRENPTHYKEKTKKWRREHPLEFRAQGALRKARTIRAVVRDGVDYLEILIRDKLVCKLCNVSIQSKAEVSFDHIIPISRGGEHSMANLQLAHLSCNMHKGASI